MGYSEEYDSPVKTEIRNGSMEILGQLEQQMEHLHDQLHKLEAGSGKRFEAGKPGGAGKWTTGYGYCKE